MTLTNSLISSNTVTGPDGNYDSGGIFIGGTMVLAGARIISNTATTGNRGGLA